VRLAAIICDLLLQRHIFCVLFKSPGGQSNTAAASGQQSRPARRRYGVYPDGDDGLEGDDVMGPSSFWMAPLRGAIGVMPQQSSVACLHTAAVLERPLPWHSYLHTKRRALCPCHTHSCIRTVHASTACKRSGFDELPSNQSRFHIAIGALNIQAS
jgi:hypothetical protein